MLISSIIVICPRDFRPEPPSPGRLGEMKCEKSGMEEYGGTAGEDGRNAGEQQSGVERS